MPVFHLLKDSDIKKRLKEQGIDTKVANRKGLEQRLKNFIILWNSQCDEENPLSRMEIGNFDKFYAEIFAILTKINLSL